MDKCIPGKIFLLSINDNKKSLVNYLEIFQLIKQKRTLGTIYLVFNIENLKVYCFIHWLVKIPIKINDLEKDIRISLPVSWPMAMIHMHHIPISFFLCSSSLVLCLRHCSSSIHRILIRRGFESGVWEGVYTDWVCLC